MQGRRSQKAPHFTGPDHMAVNDRGELVVDFLAKAYHVGAGWCGVKKDPYPVQ